MDERLLLDKIDYKNGTVNIGGKIYELKDKDFPIMDLGIASAYITLAAEDEGVGSCILGWFDEKRIKELAGIPSKRRLMLIVSLGYAAKPKRKKVRKEWDKVVSFEKY